jgi:hypothetical protein
MNAAHTSKGRIIAPVKIRKQLGCAVFPTARRIAGRARHELRQAEQERAKREIAREAPTGHL